MKTLLLIEPGIRAYKEHIVKDLSAQPDIRLVVATGLHELFDYRWVQQYTREFIRFSYADGTLLSQVRRFQQENSVRFDGVMTYVEPSVPWANDLAHELGLPVVSENRGKAVRNKAVIRDLLLAAGVPQLRYWRLDHEADVDAMLDAAPLFPLVVKPTEMMSSLGVFRVHNPLELREAFFKARRADFWDENLRAIYPDMSCEVLCEECIEGPEYSAEVVVQDGEPRLIGITKKWTVDGGYYDEVAHSFPAPDLSEEETARVRQMIDASHRALRLRNTVTHPEFRMRNGIPYLIEINHRLGGDKISRLVEKSTGLQIGRVLADVHLGNRVQLNAPTQTHSIAFLTTEREGRVVSIGNEVSNSSQVESYVEVGDLLLRDGLLGVSRLGAVISRGAPVDPADWEAAFHIQAPLAMENVADGDRIVVFQALPGDIEVLDRIERSCWSSDQRAPRATIAERLQAHPDCQYLAYSVKGRQPVGLISAVPVPSGANGRWMPWEYYATQATGPRGPGNIETLYIVSISISPEAPRGTGSVFVRALAGLCRQRGISYLRYGIRVPKYSFYAAAGVDFPAYFQGLKDGMYHEDLFKLAQNAGGRAVGYIENYFEDPPSSNYGILIEHRAGDT